MKKPKTILQIYNCINYKELFVILKDLKELLVILLFVSLILPFKIKETNRGITSNFKLTYKLQATSN